MFKEEMHGHLPRLLLLLQAICTGTRANVCPDECYTCIPATTTTTTVYNECTAATSTCKDGTGPALTPELYQQGYGCYKNVTCIKQGAFEGAVAAVTLNRPLVNLRVVEGWAFQKFEGKLTFNSSFPSLEKIESASFGFMTNVDSVVDFSGAPALTSVGFYVFQRTYCTIMMRGEYPFLSSLGTEAFAKSGNKDSAIRIDCSVGPGLVIHKTAFGDPCCSDLGFRGARIQSGSSDHRGVTGEKINCNDLSTSTTTATATTTTATSTTGTSTTTTRLCNGVADPPGCTVSATNCQKRDERIRCPALCEADTCTDKRSEQCYPPFLFNAKATANLRADAIELASAWPARIYLNETKSIRAPDTEQLRNKGVGRPRHFSPECIQQYQDLDGKEVPDVDKSKLTFRLLWSPDGGDAAAAAAAWNTSTSDLSEVVGGLPPKGLLRAGQGSDPGPFAIGAQTILYAPNAVGQYTMWMVLEDADGGAAIQSQFAYFRGVSETLNQVVVARWRFRVVEKPRFEIESFSRHYQSTTSNTDTTASYEDFGDDDGFELVCNVGETIRIAPIETIRSNRDDCASAGLQYLLKNAPAGFFANSDTGEILANPRTPTPGEVGQEVELVAADRSGEQAVVQKFVIRVRVKDEDVDSYGPGGRACANSGKVVDEIEYDKHFTCDCSDTVFKGPACTEEGPVDCNAGAVDLGDDAFDGEYTCDCTDLEGEGFDLSCDNSAFVQTRAELAEESHLRSEEQREADKRTSNKTIGSIVGGIALASALAFFGYRKRQQIIANRPINWEDQFAAMIESGAIDPEQLHIDCKPREIRRRDLTLLKVIGSGAFGEVWSAMLDESSNRGTPEYAVAAKTVKDAANSPEGTKDLLAEASVMAQVSGDPHLVSIIGVITRGDPLVLVLQFCQHGSLLAVLKKKAAEGMPIQLRDKMHMAEEVALGMKHLSNLSFIHRDLAARNVLVADGRKVGADGSSKTLDLVCKVADFGLSRGGGDDSAAAGTEDYYKSSSGVFPVRWTAPESMETLRFTVASDVWSFGVVVVELVQDGVSPYHGTSNPDVMKLTMSGGRHPKPTGCPDDLYGLLMECWDADPTKRPSFTKLSKQLELFASRRRSSAIAALGALKRQSGTGTNPASFKSAENSYHDFGFGDDNDGGNDVHDEYDFPTGPAGNEYLGNEGRIVVNDVHDEYDFPTGPAGNEGRIVVNDVHDEYDFPTGPAGNEYLGPSTALPEGGAVTDGGNEGRIVVNDVHDEYEFPAGPADSEQVGVSTALPEEGATTDGGNEGGIVVNDADFEYEIPAGPADSEQVGVEEVQKKKKKKKTPGANVTVGETQLGGGEEKKKKKKKEKKKTKAVKEGNA